MKTMHMITKICHLFDIHIFIHCLHYGQLILHIPHQELQAPDLIQLLFGIMQL